MIARLDSVLGRVTTFRLVIGALAILATVSIILGFAGLTVWPGPPQLASLAVLFVVGHIVNAGIARLARLTPHTASTSITALLLFFLLPPHIDIPRLGMTALVIGAAVASKYLIAVRGRHIFNPAAFGAFIATVFGLGPAIWWVATPVLFPVVLIGAVLVLYRTRQLDTGAIFVGVSAVILVVRYLTSGLDLATALSFALLSSPAIFLAGFMLSEPLTLPPRRWQQFLVAAIVGVVMSVPFSTGSIMIGEYEIGPISSTPECALIIGNLVAFFFGQRRGIRLEFVAKRQLTPTSWDFELRPLAPVSFSAGQFIELALPHKGTDSKGSRRVFSIASASPDSIRLGVKTSEPLSSFKQRMLELNEGDRITATSVGGDFVLPKDPATPLLLVAGGIGVTPFVGHLEQLVKDAQEAKVTPNVVVVYAVSNTSELAYLPELERSGARILIASPTQPEAPGAWEWIGPERLSGPTIMAAVPDATHRVTYLSGPPEMVGQLRTALHRAGVHHIRTDVFLGY